MTLDAKRELVAVDLPTIKAHIGTLRDFGHFHMTTHGGVLTVTEDDGSKVELEWSVYLNNTGFDLHHEQSGLRIEVSVTDIIKAAGAELMKQVAKRADGELPPLA